MNGKRQESPADLATESVRIHETTSVLGLASVKRLSAACRTPKAAANRKVDVAAARHRSILISRRILLFRVTVVVTQGGEKA